MTSCLPFVFLTSFRNVSVFTKILSVSIGSIVIVLMFSMLVYHWVFQSQSTYVYIYLHRRSLQSFIVNGVNYFRQVLRGGGATKFLTNFCLGRMSRNNNFISAQTCCLCYEQTSALMLWCTEWLCKLWTTTTAAKHEIWRRCYKTTVS